MKPCRAAKPGAKSAKGNEPVGVAANSKTPSFAVGQGADGNVPVRTVAGDVGDSHAGLKSSPR